MASPLISSLQQVFFEQFNVQPRIFRSPGRINLIGEHTDYNDGFVMPAAIDKSVFVAISKRDDGRIRIWSTDFREMYEGHVSDVCKSGMGWPNYVLGVLDQLQQEGYQPKGFDMALASDLPIGAGLSSSAAVECATVFALDAIFGYALPLDRMIRLAQRAEHSFAGVMCGIMDQFASMYGREGHFVKLDCRTMEYEYHPFVADDLTLLMLNTNVKHSLASTAYNRRRMECAQGLAWVQEAYPDVQALRDVTVEMLDRQVRHRDATVDMRCRFVVEEIARLHAACSDLVNGDIVSLGKKLLATHDGLRDMYEVSCQELDYLVEKVRTYPGVIGARMMGGGFGGCTINIVRTEAVEKLVAALSIDYEKDMNLPLTAFSVKPSDGTSELSL
jgi:galactokinase